MSSGLAGRALRVTREELVDQLYADDETLRVKQRVHREFRTNPLTIVDHVVGLLGLTGNEVVLDLGCGNGLFLREVAARTTLRGRVVGLDLAGGVLMTARRRLDAEDLTVELLEHDAGDLDRFPSGSFDRVMINYALHHVPDIDRCLAGVRRVLRPGGRLLVSTDSVESMAELYALHAEALLDAGYPGQVLRTQKSRFALDTAGREALGRHFPNVRLVPYDDVLAFDDTASLLGFYAVGTTYCGAALASNPHWSAEIAGRVDRSVLDRVETVIGAAGEFRITKHSGTFVCAPS